MLTSALIGCTAAALVLTDGSAGLSALRVYHGVERPVMIDVTLPPGHETAAIVLMNDRGDLHTDPAAVRTGPVDLAAVLPDIWRMRRAGFLQLIVDEQPVGTSLVVQPMLSRMIPVTEEAVAPGGYAYTRIVDWYDEASGVHASDLEMAAVRRDHIDDADADDETKDDEAPTEEERPARLPAPDPDDPWLTHQRLGPRLLCGMRIYPERDVIMHTTKGDVRIAMRPDHAPNTAWNFLQLCGGGFYRDVAFHRVVPLTRAGHPFVIQAGDPTATGSGGPGYWLPLERSGLDHDFGVISMARDLDPDSAGSQFFFCLSREGTARLDGSYCAFGYAVDGADAILAIADVELADIEAGRPAEPPRIVSTEIVPASPRRPGTGRPGARVMRPAARRPEPAGPPRQPR